jgi:hypothetical protein
MFSVKWEFSSMDAYQRKVIELEYNRNFILMCGRQVGKSEIVSKKIADFLLNNPNKHLMIVSGVERQASGLYNKTLRLIEKNYPRMLKKGKDKPLRTVFKLTNGSVLRTEPVGIDGSGARQHTLDGIIFEEMQLIPEEAYAAITPMLLTTGGFIWMLGTAWATEGYVYERLSDPEFEVIRVNSEEVAEQRPEPQKTIMLKHLANEKKRLTEAQYAQEYLAIPSENLRQIFPDNLIKRTLTLKRDNKIDGGKEYICGVDPAGMGEDEGSISILDYNSDQEKMKQVEHEITVKLYTTQTTDRIINLERRYNFKKIYIDDGGLGFGVFSELLKEDDTKFKTIALNNSARPLDWEDKKEKKILGDEMIFNLLMLMERGKIELLDDAEIRESLKSYKFEYSKDRTKLIISSNYNHPVQSIMRAAWHMQGKDLKLAVYSIKV